MDPAVTGISRISRPSAASEVHRLSSMKLYRLNSLFFPMFAYEVGHVRRLARHTRPSTH